MDEVQLVIHACNIVAPYLHSRTIEYLQDISIEEVKPVEVLPIYPLMRSYLDFAGRLHEKWNRNSRLTSSQRI